MGCIVLITSLESSKLISEFSSVLPHSTSFSLLEEVSFSLEIYSHELVEPCLQVNFLLALRTSVEDLGDTVVFKKDWPLIRTLPSWTVSRLFVLRLTLVVLSCASHSNVAMSSTVCWRALTTFTSAPKARRARTLARLLALKRAKQLHMKLCTKLTECPKHTLGSPTITLLNQTSHVRVLFSKLNSINWRKNKLKTWIVPRCD